MVVTDRERLFELAKVWDRGGRHIAQSAASMALVAKEPEDERHRDWLMDDFGQATANRCWQRPTSASALAIRQSSTTSRRSGSRDSPTATSPST